MITGSDAKSLLTALREQRDNALLRVTKNGPTDTEGSMLLHNSTVRYEFLVNLTRRYFTNEEL